MELLRPFSNPDEPLTANEDWVDNSTNIMEFLKRQLGDIIQKRTLWDVYISLKNSDKSTNNNMANNERDTTMLDKYTSLLKTNKNLILTGAPGTGKTYMAKEIAKAMGAEVGFVQFHPSYDYTDFVEGLRPINHDNVVGFERKDGAFKEFCAEALNIRDTTNFDECIDKLFDSVGEEILLLETPTGKQFGLSRSARGNLRLHTGKELKESGVITKKDLRAEYSGIPTFKWWKGYYQGIITYLTNNYNLINDSNIIEDNTPHVFIIDEINRGEISKLFGELFFSIDPGYRGEKGKVNTQYQNMVPEGDVFKDGFYVPENVYIIGTMNDIDRSVESMDFAMRRRFAWQEVTAEESYTNMIENDPEFVLVKDEIKQRMSSLNKAIAETEGLDEAYQIGAAYFRKYLNYKEKANAFDCLWENHLKGLLFEYLRGNRRAKALLEKLHDAYNKKSLNE
jgi:5-methylcytosine-specific restriction endonuclease McrBC GTP-binding regulatory subunit McrB